jgi:hypothetical protein
LHLGLSRSLHPSPDGAVRAVNQVTVSHILATFTAEQRVLGTPLYVNGGNDLESLNCLHDFVSRLFLWFCFCLFFGGGY